jgi:acyl-[acyl-carrier-protein]-phospholipid O-acyltransferase/long-chain-fatty-acid--[acyl-carrier-protein] ligase
MPLFATMFLGAFNDNLFRTALVTFVTFRATDIAEETKLLMVSLAVGLFMLPYFLFSATAGQLTDKYHKHHIIRLTKIAEIIIMSLAAIGFLTGHIIALIGLLFLMGAQSTFFGPAKYSVMPDHLKEEELLGGNGLMEAGTFLAILLGTLVGGLLIANAEYGITLTAVVVILIAAVGYITSIFVPFAPQAAANIRVNYNFITSTYTLLKNTYKEKELFRVVLLISWFWLIGAAFLAQIPNLAYTVFGLNEMGLTVLMVIFSLGVGVGSLCTNAILKSDITLRLVPASAIGLTVFIAHFAMTDFVAPMWGQPLTMQEFLLSWEGAWVAIDLFGVAVAGGIYIVPLYALLQSQADPMRRSQIIATNNVMNAFFMVVSSLIAAALLSMGLSILDFFLLLAIANGVVAGYLFIIRRKL